MTSSGVEMHVWESKNFIWEVFQNPGVSIKQFGVMIFRFCTILGVMETQLVTQVELMELVHHASSLGSSTLEPGSILPVSPHRGTARFPVAGRANASIQARSY